MNATSRRLRKSCLALVAAGATCVACAHRPVIHLRKGELGPAPLPVKLALVSPLALRWSEPSAFLSYLRTLDLEDELCASGQLPTLGPGELLGPAELALGDGPEESDVARAALKSGVPVGAIMLVRSWAERREQRSAVSLDDAAGRSAGHARDAGATLSVRLELTLPASHTLLLEATGEQELDLSADHPLLDAQPELGPLLRRTLGDALAALGSSLVLPPRLELGLRVAPAMPPALAYAQLKRPSLNTAIAAQDLLEQEVERNAAVDLLAVGLPPTLRSSMSPSRPGLLVLEAQQRARAAGLLAGDRILQIAGEPATHPCAPLRAAQLRGQVKLLVQRGSGQLSLSL